MTPRPESASEPGGTSPQVLQGEVERVTYHDADSLYSVLKVAPERGYDDPASLSMFRSARLTAVGELARPAVGLRLRLHGQWESHPSHGRQFRFEGFEALAPLGGGGLERYLASGAFPGVGEKLARRIVEKLGSSALERIRDDPACLEGVQGLRPPVRATLAEAVRQGFSLHRLQAFLRTSGLGPRLSAAVVRRFGHEGEELVRRDPYRLAGAVPGIGFATADRIARTLGLAPDSIERVRAGLLHGLRAAANEGHSLLGERRLFAAARALLDLELPAERLAEALSTLEGEREVVIEPDLLPEAEGRAVYLPWLEASERGLAESLERLTLAREARPLAGEAELERAERESGLCLDREQRAAVLGLAREPLALLTGGPGVGKTTIVRLVVALAEAAGARVALASPTGRAAKRLAEATGRPASTIHRLLGFDPKAGGFLHGPSKPLEADLLVVDEMSMLDVALAHHLFGAIRAPARAVLVGDPDQLPSVAAGNVLQEMIRSRRLPVFRLARIHRQEEGGLIVENAHRALAGRPPLLPERGDRSADFYLFPAEDPARCAELTVEVVVERIPRSFGHDWARDVQVLAPMYRGECGVDALNHRLREALGGTGREVQLGGRAWRAGDRVIQTRNDYAKEVFNGDMGHVARASEEGLLVAFPEQEVFYAPGELGDLQPAFAITVHRSQGSEYPVVVLPLAVGHHLMLQRNLLYTAMTRARKLLVLVGSRRALGMALDNAEQGLRMSALAVRMERLAARRSPA